MHIINLFSSIFCFLVMLYRINKEKIICENCGYTLGKQYPDDYIYHGLEMNPSLNKFIET
jgi:hypothetical protein